MMPFRFIQGQPYFEDAGGVLRRLGYWLIASSSQNPPNLNAGTQTVISFAVPGAAMGDPVVSGFSLDLQGIQLCSYVDTAGSVATVFRNGTAGAINLGSGTLTVRLLKFT